MKKGENINGYIVLQDFTTTGGGLSMWSFAQRSGKDYFIKEFLSPKYPVEGAPGSPRTKEQKLRKCQQFEEHQNSLIAAVSSKCGEGGNLIFTRDFFREGTKYYKITEKIDVASMDVGDIAKLPLDSRILIMLNVAHSLEILHKLGIVHGDLKPGNILIKKTALDGYVAKLIDFDNSFFSGKPPSLSDEVVGDLVFYSPELARYIQNDEVMKSHELQLSSDVFALGLVYSLYLTGDLPVFDQTKYQYPCIASNAGQVLSVNEEGIPSALQTLINAMLNVNAATRPMIRDIYLSLKSLRTPSGVGVTSVTLPIGRSTLEDAGESSKLKGKLIKKSAHTKGPASGSASSPRDEGLDKDDAASVGKLSGKLLKKLT